MIIDIKCVVHPTWIILRGLSYMVYPTWFILHGLSYMVYPTWFILPKNQRC